jgi:transposase
MADLLIDANARAGAARRAGQAALSDGDLAGIRSWYRGAVAKGIADNAGKRTPTALDGARLARRFRDHEDMILRFATDLAVECCEYFSYCRAYGIDHSGLSYWRGFVF